MRPRPPRVSVTISLADTAMNAIFIYGLLGFPAMGVEGASVSTLVSGFWS